MEKPQCCNTETSQNGPGESFKLRLYLPYKTQQKQENTAACEQVKKYTGSLEGVGVGGPGVRVKEKRGESNRAARWTSKSATQIISKGGKGIDRTPIPQGLKVWKIIKHESSGKTGAIDLKT